MKVQQDQIQQEIAEIHIDTQSIPDHARDRLAAATFDFIHEILRQPESRKALEAKKAELRAAGLL